MLASDKHGVRKDSSTGLAEASSPTSAKAGLGHNGWNYISRPVVMERRGYLSTTGPEVL